MITLLTLLACSSPTPAQATLTTQEILHKADLHDGTEDKVVSECTGCGLGMKGSPEHSVTKDGYELHFCSESCKMGFEKDEKAGLEKLKKVVTKAH